MHPSTSRTHAHHTSSTPQQHAHSRANTAAHMFCFIGGRRYSSTVAGNTADTGRTPCIQQQKIQQHEDRAPCMQPPPHPQSSAACDSSSPQPTPSLRSSRAAVVLEIQPCRCLKPRPASPGRTFRNGRAPQVIDGGAKNERVHE